MQQMTGERYRYVFKTHRRSQEKKLGGGGFFVCITDDIATDGGLVPPDYNVI